MCFRTGVQLSSPPPKKTYANTILVANAKFAVFGNAFGIMVNLSDYDTDTHIQTEKATYKDIQAWVLETYGTHVTNLDNSRTNKA